MWENADQNNSYYGHCSRSVDLKTYEQQPKWTYLMTILHTDSNNIRVVNVEDIAEINRMCKAKTLNIFISSVTVCHQEILMTA